MPFSLPPFQKKGYLASYRAPALTYASGSRLAEALRPTWSALHAADARAALAAARAALAPADLPPETRAALLAAQASAHARQGVVDAARAAARASIELHPAQWTAERVLVDLLRREQRHQDALERIEAFEPPATPAAWDEPLEARDRHLQAASCAWLVQDWDRVFARLTEAFPEGLAAMPEPLQEDWFRLAFYRDTRVEAAAAARHLIDVRSTEDADVLLQAVVMQGWYEEALELYRVLYTREGSSELLRRRLVGLCIRRGNLQEARRLMETGALSVAV